MPALAAAESGWTVVTVTRPLGMRTLMPAPMRSMTLSAEHRSDGVTIDFNRRGSR
jgi:hypothetical protein